MDDLGGSCNCRAHGSFACTLKPSKPGSSVWPRYLNLDIVCFGRFCDFRRGLIVILPKGTGFTVAAMGVMVHLQHAAPSASHVAVGALILGVIVVLADYVRMLYLRSKMVPRI